MALYKEKCVFVCFVFIKIPGAVCFKKSGGGAKKLEVFTDVYASEVAIVLCGGHKKVGAPHLEMSIIVVTCIIIPQCCEWTPNFMCFPFRHASCHLKKCCRQLPSRQKILNMVILRNAGGKSRLSVEGLEVTCSWISALGGLAIRNNILGFLFYTWL